MSTAEPMADVTTARPARCSARRLPTWSALLLWGVMMAPLATWGLPSARYDQLLFGGETPWDAARYNAADALDERRTRLGGADTDLDPRNAAGHVVELTSAEADRAAILTRFRLYTRQPDEMITFMALQRMNPRQLDFDPRLYQYGGGYIYMIGATLGTASLLGLTELTTDAGAYLKSPDKFARFYLVARAVSLLFGALTLLAVVRLARRVAGRTAGWLAFLCVAASPVFITGVLEAKPHVPSMCLVLWALLAALDYCRAGRWQAAVRLGLLAGGATGLVLTGLVSMAIWPVLPVCRRHDWRRACKHLALAAAVVAAVYVVTNPYVLYNALCNRPALVSNIGNSIDMYRDRLARAPQGASRVAELLVESCGPGVVGLGIIGLVLLLSRYPRQTTVAAASGAAMLLISVALAAGKPAEFARFLLLPAILLSVAAAWLLTEFSRRRAWIGILATVAVLAVMRTPAYLHAFVVDARAVHESRYQAGRYLRDRAAEPDAIGVLQEPAPYAVPPLDFAHRRVILLPGNQPAAFDPTALPTWLVFAADDRTSHQRAWWHPYYTLSARFPVEDVWSSPIAWANKPVFVYRRGALSLHRAR